jgi:hypothetical protein
MVLIIVVNKFQLYIIIEQNKLFLCREPVTQGMYMRQSFIAECKKYSVHDLAKRDYVIFVHASS